MSMPGRGWMDMPPPDGEDPLAPSRGCMVGILIGAAIWVVILLVLWHFGVIS